VRGPGFRFEAPDSWHATRTPRGVVAKPAAGDAGVLVSATTFRLLKAYEPARFTEAVKELDGVAAKLARNAHGKLTSSETTTVDGHRIRAYRFTSNPVSGGSFQNRIGFVLRGRTEVQLLCQAPAGKTDPDGACALLFGSFTLPA
jgi:hypothetical protein